MKNDDQMYQSVLSRRDAYRLQQQKRTRTVRRVVPVLACFCFTVGLGLGIWKHQSNLPHVPVKTVTETTATTETTTTIAETTSTAVSEPSQIRQTRPTTSVTVQTETVTEVSTTVTNAMTTASSQQTSTAAVTATAAPQTNLQTQSITTTVSAVATQSVTYIPATVPPLTARITPQTSTMEVVTTAATPATTVATPSTTSATMPTTVATLPTTAETPPATTAETTEPIQPEPPPQEPSDNYVALLQFREISDLTETLTTFAQSDGSSYEEPERSAYLKMFYRFLQDGFVYELLETDSISRIRERGISLYPYARFEDIGVGYAVNYCDKFYYVTFYSADTAFLDGSGSISEYLQARMKRQTDKEITVQEQTVSVVFANGGQIVANSFVDDSHYLNVRTSATEEELTAFLNEISYEQTPLQSDRG
jgi:hypothetical protein